VDVVRNTSEAIDDLLRRMGVTSSVAGGVAESSQPPTDPLDQLKEARGTSRLGGDHALGIRRAQAEAAGETVARHQQIEPERRLEQVYALPAHVKKIVLARWVCGSERLTVSSALHRCAPAIAGRIRSSCLSEGGSASK
jgi:hypothetical protein